MEKRLRIVTVVALALAMLVPATAGGAVVQTAAGEASYGITEAASIEFAFRELINEERAATGAAPLAIFGDLVDAARLQAIDIAEADVLFHNPDLASVTASENWYKLGENVGYGPTVDVLHQAFMDSAPHAANLLKDVYNYIGVGVTVDEGGTIWVAVVFMYGPEGLSSPAEPEPDTATYRLPFADDDGSLHESAIAAVNAAGITSGCDISGELFCPTDLVTRAQMATFLARGMDLPAATQDYFTDDDGSTHEDSINRLAEAGVTLGCGDGRFCPSEPMTRGQTASLIVRALDLPTTSVDFFTDDDSSTHQVFINALAAAGVTSGCGDEAYCPSDRVTRGQMATFLARALGLI